MRLADCAPRRLAPPRPHLSTRVHPHACPLTSSPFHTHTQTCTHTRTRTWVPAPVLVAPTQATPSTRARRSCTAVLGLIGSLGLVALYGANVNAMRMVLEFFDADMQIRP